HAGEPDEDEDPLIPEPEMLRHQRRCRAPTVLSPGEVRVQLTQLPGGFLAILPARLPGLSMDSSADPPGVQEGQRKDREHRPERPVLADVRQRSSKEPLRPDFFGQDALPRNPEFVRLAEEVASVHRPHREITRAVIAWLEGRFSARSVRPIESR